jgi:hypothetical protein
MTYNIFSIALHNYDKLTKENITLNKKNTDIDIENFNFLYDNNIKNENVKNMDIIGLYDKKNNIWIWGYILFNTKIKKIFDIIYDDIEKNDVKNIIKYTFLNSKFILSDNLQLDIILSLSTYYLKSEKLIIIDINDYYTYYASYVK